jgi:hypothetical protein
MIRTWKITPDTQGNAQAMQRRAWKQGVAAQAVYRKVDNFGLVQGVCGVPNFDRPGTATEGQVLSF